jgi:hypothetical protein
MDPRLKPRSAALLFGLNYPGTAAQLSGCVNDVVSMASYLRDSLGFADVQAITDDGPGARPEDTKGAAMVRHLYAMALRSWSESLEVVWLHFSGHGSWVTDGVGGDVRDERDGRDEALCPSDFATSGMLRDDVLQQLLALFNPRTRVVFVVDACHSGTMGDLRWSWTPARRAVLENVTAALVPANVIMISGCSDHQTSADAWDATEQRFEGALTGALLDVLQADPQLLGNAFATLHKVHALLAHRGFSQVPVLTSSHDLRAGAHLLPPAPSTSAPSPAPSTSYATLLRGGAGAARMCARSRW